MLQSQKVLKQFFWFNAFLNGKLFPFQTGELDENNVILLMEILYKHIFIFNNDNISTFYILVFLMAVNCTLVQYRKDEGAFRGTLEPGMSERTKYYPCMFNLPFFCMFLSAP